MTMNIYQRLTELEGRYSARPNGFACMPPSDTMWEDARELVAALRQADTANIIYNAAIARLIVLGEEALTPDAYETVKRLIREGAADARQAREVIHDLPALGFLRDAKPAAEHPHYTSTYCIHGLHDQCRLTCKTCDEGCQCDCHRSSRDAEAPK